MSEYCPNCNTDITRTVFDAYGDQYKGDGEFEVTCEGCQKTLYVSAEVDVNFYIESGD